MMDITLIMIQCVQCKAEPTTHLHSVH